MITDTLLDFNLFLPAGAGKLLFFRSSDLEFTNAHRLRLLENSVRTVYVREAEKRHYQQYLERHLPEVLANPAIETKKKATLLYSVSTQVVKECLEDPRSSAMLPRTRALAEGTVDFVLKNDESLGRLAALMATDYYTYTHSINVSVFAVALAHELGVGRDEVTEFAQGALLHDVGKSRLPSSLITKAGPLTEDEFHRMKQHVEFGERILRASGKLGHVGMLAVKQHHEKLDGTGYPRALSTEQVHLFGRIAAIADCFDAMTTTRSYQAAFTAYDALMAMKTRMRDKYDQPMLDAFIRLLRSPDAPPKTAGL